VGAVEVLDDPFAPPEQIDPVPMLEAHLAVGWAYEVELVVDAPIAVVARGLPGGLGRLEPIDDTTTRVVGSTDNPWWYAERLAGLPAPFRVVHGPELQRSVREIGARLLAASGAGVVRDDAGTQSA
jgi:hypothetical protein